MVEARLPTPDNNNHPDVEREWTLFIVIAALLGGGSAAFLVIYWLLT